MKLREIDIRNFKYQDNRVRAFRERLWQENDGHNPKSMFIGVLFSALIVATGVILITAYIMSR